MTLCSCQNEVNIDFANTEWISDSLVLTEGLQWKEFIYFDSIGNFNRASWWSDNYLLDNGELNNSTIITENDSYQIEIIDSFNIKITKRNYQGFFYGNPWTKDKDFKSSLNRFIVGDSIKKQLIGKWEFVKNELELYEHLKLYDTIPEFASRKLLRFAQREINENLTLEFTKANHFLAKDNENGEIEFRFKVDDKEIDLSRSDYVISIDYKLSSQNELILTKDYQTMGKTTTYFKKENTEANKR